MRSSHNTKAPFFELVEEYIEKRQLAESHARVYRVLSRAIARYQGFVKATDVLIVSAVNRRPMVQMLHPSEQTSSS